MREMGREDPTCGAQTWPGARRAGSLCTTVCAHLFGKSVSRSIRKTPPDPGRDLPDDVRVDYAVDLMVVLRCTQQLLFRLKQFHDAPAVRSTTRLGDWYGNLIRMGNRHVLLFISERSRLPVLIPVREANRLRLALPDAVCQMLAAVGVPAEAIERERLQMSQIAFGRTRSRSLLGSLNDFSLMTRMRFITSRNETLDVIARELAETPLILPFDGAHPSTVTRQLLDAK